MHYFTLNKLLTTVGVLALVLMLIFFYWWWGGAEIMVENNNGASVLSSGLPRSPLSGIVCENANRRPIAVMLASDPITRPLSGISEADLVFEMPVTPSGVTRTMAVYQCNEPKEIGSVRSAREDFIPLVAGLGAVYVHWGGEKEALKKLNDHIVDNIDAMKYENIYFYRKNNLPQPHNGFTGFDKLSSAIKDFNYSVGNKFSGYIQGDKQSSKNLLSLIDTISIDYPYPFNVNWVYDKERDAYKRFRGNNPETDKINGNQVEVKTVIVMRTTSKYINLDYITINTSGEGDIAVYQNGLRISGRWKKDPAQLDSKLFFYDTEDKEIEFMPGKKWIEIVTE